MKQIREVSMNFTPAFNTFACKYRCDATTLRKLVLGHRVGNRDLSSLNAEL